MKPKDIVYDYLTAKRVEPKPRMCGGKFGYVYHKYPIKNGISVSDILAEQIAKNNELLDRLKKVK